MSETAKHRGFHAFLLVVSGLLALFLVVAVVMVSLHWAKVQSLYQSTAGTLAELQAVRSAIQTKYNARQVNVSFKRHNAVPILSVQIVNASVVSGLTDAELRDKALEIADTARGALRSPDGYDAYEVVFVQQQGVGFTFKTNRQFLFRANELPSETIETEH